MCVVCTVIVEERTKMNCHFSKTYGVLIHFINQLQRFTNLFLKNTGPGHQSPQSFTNMFIKNWARASISSKFYKPLSQKLGQDIHLLKVLQTCFSKTGPGHPSPQSFTNLFLKNWTRTSISSKECTEARIPPPFLQSAWALCQERGSLVPRSE